MGLISKWKELRHGYNAFLDQDRELREQGRLQMDRGVTYASRPDRPRLSTTNERSVIAAMLTRLAIDFSAVDFRHVRLDDQKRYIGDIDSELNNCLTVEANLDQNSRAFFRDVAFTIFDKGAVAMVPVKMTIDPHNSNAFDVQNMRVGEIAGWQPKDVLVDVYNEDTGRREQLRAGKNYTPIVENPFYAVMNEPNSTLQRLVRKLNLLDQVDEASGSGKLDLIIQLPYVIKRESQREQAEIRRQDIQDQLRGSQHGIAYTDGSEKIIQLNRPVENNLLGQVEYLMALLYEQMGLTKGVMDGTADEQAMINYYERAIKPLVEVVALEMHRKFLSKTARTQKQAIAYFRDPFRFVPLSALADIIDVLGRNEVASSNELRQTIGWKPVLDDPNADKLRNSNMPQPGEPGFVEPAAEADAEDPFEAINHALDEVFQELGVEE